MTPAKGQSQRALAALREMIVTNRLPPGSTHLEAELAEMLGMSRTPVREAAVILAEQGLVEVRPRRGLRVLPLSARDMQEIYAILTELESLAAFEAARARPDAAALAPLRAQTAAMTAALDRGDRRAWAEADDAFHAGLVALAGNRRLAGVVATMADQARRARFLTLSLRPAPYASSEDHRRLVEAIARGDAEDARSIHRAHRLSAMETMLGLLAAHGLAAV